MDTKLTQLQERVDTLEQVADEVGALVIKMVGGEQVQPQLSEKGQQWYRAARELLKQHGFSGLKEFDDCYDTSDPSGRRRRWDIGATISYSLPSAPSPEAYASFYNLFLKAKSLVKSLVEEVRSRELPVFTQLSFAVAANEFDTADSILAQAKDDEILLRVSGVIARVAIERHLFTLVDARSVNVPVNPPSKKRPDASDLLVALEKARVITQIQKSELDTVFRVGNNCAHPEEKVTQGDVERMIRRARELAFVLV